MIKSALLCTTLFLALAGMGISSESDDKDHPEGTSPRNTTEKQQEGNTNPAQHLVEPVSQEPAPPLNLTEELEKIGFANQLYGQQLTTQVPGIPFGLPVGGKLDQYFNPTPVSNTQFFANLGFNPNKQ